MRQVNPGAGAVRLISDLTAEDMPEARLRFEPDGSIRWAPDTTP